MARYHVQTAYEGFKVRYEESRAQCRHYAMLLFTAYPYCAMTSHFVWASRTTPLHKQGQELRSEQTVTPLHEQDHLYLFLRLNNSETFVDEAF